MGIDRHQHWPTNVSILLMFAVDFLAFIHPSYSLVLDQHPKQYWAQFLNTADKSKQIP